MLVYKSSFWETIL